MTKKIRGKFALVLIFGCFFSGGVIGRSKPDPGAKPMEIIFSNPDKLFSNDFPTPRFGQGAFQVALQAVLDQVNSLQTWIRIAWHYPSMLECI